MARPTGKLARPRRSKSRTTATKPLARPRRKVRVVVQTQKPRKVAKTALKKKRHPVHGNMFSLSHNIPTPVAEACGSALPYSGIFRRELTISTAERAIVIFSNVARAGTVALVIGNGATPGLTTQTIPTLALADDAGGPTSAKSMKAAVTLVSATAPLSRAGRITVLNSKQRFFLAATPSTSTQANWNTFIDTVKAHPDAKSYSATDFAHPVTFHCHPVDSRRYNEFVDFFGAVSADEFMRSLAVWPGSDPYARPMSSVIMIFEQPPTAQEYTASFRAAYYTRWPLNTIPGQTQRPVPTAPLSNINAHQQALERLGSQGVPDQTVLIG